MSKLTKDIRLKKTIRVEDGKVPFTSKDKKQNIYLVLGVLIAWYLFMSLGVGDIFADIRSGEDLAISLLTLFVIFGIPGILAIYLIINFKNKKEVMKYKSIPNPDYDAVFAKKINTRVRHGYGKYSIYKYNDGTYTLDSDDTFYELGNFSFSGSDIITNTNGRYNGKSTGSLLGTAVGGLAGGIPGATLGNVNSRNTYGSVKSTSVSEQTKGKSSLIFFSVDEQKKKQIKAEITQNEAADLERFFYR